jgi:hypothetical protein
VLTALPGVQPLALSRVPLTGGTGDAWHVHRGAATPLAIAAQRAHHENARPTRHAIAAGEAAGILPPCADGGIVEHVGDRLSSFERVSPPPARAPPRDLVL